jgi:hypothetical protein
MTGRIMTLEHHSNYPSTRSYVLKLHRDAGPESDRMTGWLENMSSGCHYEFNSAEQLLACLADDLAASNKRQPGTARNSVNCIDREHK